MTALSAPRGLIALVLLLATVAIAMPEKEFAEMANLAERWITGSASATVGAVDDELQRGLQGLQDDEQALRHGDLGEGATGVDLVNNLFTPNDLGATSQPSGEQTQAEQTEKQIKEVKAQISQAYKDYAGAQKMKITLDSADDKIEAAKEDVKPHGLDLPAGTRAGVNSHNVTESGHSPFVIDSEEPWKVYLLHPNGTVRRHNHIVAPEPQSLEKVQSDIANAVMKLDTDTVTDLHNKAEKDADLEAELADKESDKAKFEKISAGMQNQFRAIKMGVSVASSEIKSKAKKQREAQEAESQAIHGKEDFAAEAAKESAMKSTESAIKITKRGEVQIARDSTNVIITRKPPPEDKQIPGVPDGPPQYANFSNPVFDPTALLITDSLVNNPEFQEWAQAKPHADVAVARNFRKQAYEEWMAQQRIADGTAREVAVTSQRLMAKAHALASMTFASWKTQEMGRRKFEEQATVSISNWHTELEKLRKDQVTCDRPECDENTWKIWVKLEKLLDMVTTARMEFTKWSNWIRLDVNNGNTAYRAEVEQKLWAQLYEAKDDLTRLNVINAKEQDRMKSLETLYEDRVSDEVRAKQVATAMANLPVPDEVTLPFLINGSLIEQTVETQMWAKCRCPLEAQEEKPTTATRSPPSIKLVCNYCERDHWEPAEQVLQYTEKSILTRFAMERLRWGTVPRTNPVVCDLENQESIHTLRCVYKCGWMNFYGSNWYAEWKKNDCRERVSEGPARDRCEDTFFDIPLKYGPAIRGAACEQQMSLQALLEKKFKQIKAASPTAAPPKEIVLGERRQPGHSEAAAQESAVDKLEAQASEREHKIDVIWPKSVKQKQEPWTGWKCVRQTGAGTVYGFECTLLDQYVGFLAVKGGERVSASGPPSKDGVCVQWERNREESRSVCSCCPRFKCLNNCQATYDVTSRQRYDNELRFQCNKEFHTGTDIARCETKIHDAKRVLGDDNLESDLSLPVPRRPFDPKELDDGEKVKLLPVWKDFSNTFGPDWQTSNKARRWYCKEMWKYSALDFRNMTRLTAPNTGYCGQVNDGKIHSLSADKTIQCQKSVVPNYVVSAANPYQASDAQFILYSDVDTAVRPPGVLWPPQNPPRTNWPSADVAPDLQPSRLSYCTSCCQQLYPKLRGCPAIGKVMNAGSKYDYLATFPVETLRTAGDYEWELAGEEDASANATAALNDFLKSVAAVEGTAAFDDVSEANTDSATSGGERVRRELETSLLQFDSGTRRQNERAGPSTGGIEEADVPRGAISLLSEEEHDPAITDDQFNPGFTWAGSRWGNRKRAKRTFVYPRRRRRYFSSPVERAAKNARNAAQHAVESTQKVFYRREKDYEDLKQMQEGQEKVETQRGEKRLQSRQAAVKQAAKVNAVAESNEKELMVKAAEGAKAETDQEMAALDYKFSIRLKAAKDKIAEAKLTNEMMLRKFQQVSEDTSEVRGKNEAKARQASIDAEKATAELAKNYQTLSNKYEDSYDIVGYQKDEIAHMAVDLKSMKVKVQNAESKIEQIAYDNKLIKEKAQSGQRVTADDLSDITTAAIAKLSQLNEHITEEVQKKLNKGWDNIVHKTTMRFFAGSQHEPAVNVEATILDLQDAMVKEFRKGYEENQCTTKALDAYFRLSIEKEMGFVSSRGKFFKLPVCERLSSMRGKCDADNEKVCSTVIREAPIVGGKPKTTDYKCSKYVDGDRVQLQKYMYCPLVTNDFLKHGGTQCQVLKRCSAGESGAAPPTPDCALW